MSRILLMVAYTTLAWLLFFVDAQDVASMNPLQSLLVLVVLVIGIPKAALLTQRFLQRLGREWTAYRNG